MFSSYAVPLPYVDCYISLAHISNKQRSFPLRSLNLTPMSFFHFLSIPMFLVYTVEIDHFQNLQNGAKTTTFLLTFCSFFYQENWHKKRGFYSPFNISLYSLFSSEKNVFNCILVVYFRCGLLALYLVNQSLNLLLL